MQNGGEICVNAKVERIAVKDGRVIGVEAGRDGAYRRSGSALDHERYGDFPFAALPRRIAPAGMRRKAQKAHLSHRSFVLQLGLSNRVEAPSHFIDELPFMEEQHKLFTGPGEA